MNVTLAGQTFRVGPDAELSAAERASLQRLIGSAEAAPAPAPVSFELGPPPWPDANPDDYPDFTAAAVSARGSAVRVTHRRFLAEIDPFAKSARLYRRETDGSGLGVALRVALAATLPAQGGLPLHAAGIATGAGGVVFFGPSGAGKSTLSATSPYPVLSDELVAVAGTPFELRATGFWGTLGEGEPVSACPLRALVELDKGPSFRLERLPRPLALRRLLGVIQVPALAPLWTLALGVLGRLVDATPVFRMAWSPAQPPWAELERALHEPLACASSR